MDVTTVCRSGVSASTLTRGIDRISFTGRLVFGTFASLAEFERDLTPERTMAAKTRSVCRSRKPQSGLPRQLGGLRPALRGGVPLTPEQEEHEERRCGRMAPNIEKVRADMAAEQKERDQDLRRETRKIIVQGIAVAVTLVGAGMVIGSYLASRNPPQALPPQVIFQPGSIVVQQAPLKP